MAQKLPSRSLRWLKDEPSAKEHSEKIKVAELCDDLKLFIEKHPTQYKDQLDPPRRLDRIKSDLGERTAANLRPKEIEAWLDGLTNGHAQRGTGKPLSDASVNRYRVMLSAAYKRAIKNEKVTENPVKGTSQRKLRNNVIRWLRQDEDATCKLR